MAIKQDLTGRTFGRWFIQGFSHYGKGRMARWFAKCTCGNTGIVIGVNLLQGGSKSCGCLQKEGWLKRVTKHNMSRSFEYRAWAHMKHRCSNVRDKNYKHYGGRGIKVCSRWQKSFINFLDDMGPRPEKGTLERVNNAKGYSKRNCCWATQKDQARNTRRTLFVQWEDKLVSLGKLAEDHGMRPDVLRQRIILGWPIQKAISVPVKTRRL